MVSRPHPICSKNPQFGKPRLAILVNHTPTKEKGGSLQFCECCGKISCIVVQPFLSPYSYSSHGLKRCGFNSSSILQKQDSNLYLVWLCWSVGAVISLKWKHVELKLLHLKLKFEGTWSHIKQDLWHVNHHWHSSLNQKRERSQASS